MQVLVIEDSEVDFRLIERALGDQFPLVHALSLADGLNLAKMNCFDLVILDLTLDDSRGYETFEKVHGVLSHIPILVLSGMDDEELALRAVSNGAQDYIRKSRLLDYPLDRAARYAIERRRSEDAQISAQKRSEEEHREQARFARSIVDSLSAHIAILDEAGNIIEVNTAWKRFAEQNGLPLKNFGVGSSYLEACNLKTVEQPLCGDGELVRSVAAGIRSILKGDQDNFFVEYPCHSPTEERWFIMRATPFVGGGPIRVVVSHENITSRKNAERLTREQCALQEAAAAMEKVLGVVGHELRTPLAALRAISEYLVTDGARNTAEADRFLREISEEVDRMSDTVNNILEAARLNSGRARWNWSEVDVQAAMEEAVSTIRPLIDASKVQLEMELYRSTLPTHGDANAIQRLLVNLLSNSRKHTKSGRIAVCGRQYTDQKGKWLEFVVEDTGRGIAPELVARLGEAFSLNSGIVGNNYVSGTGLGLAICKGILLAHGGEMLIDSTQYIGTKVTVRLRADLEAAVHGDTVHVGECEEVEV